MAELKTILVISNEKLLYEKLKTLLDNDGLDLKFALSSDKGLKTIIETMKPQVMVVDPEIPGMRGIKLSMLIRSWSPAPILMISPAQSGPNEIRILDVTSKDWLSEPLGVDLVAVRVNAII
jgi:two-component system KDP operon response regulator KdpE